MAPMVGCCPDFRLAKFQPPWFFFSEPTDQNRTIRTTTMGDRYDRGWNSRPRRPLCRRPSPPATRDHQMGPAAHRGDHRAQWRPAARSARQRPFRAVPLAQGAPRSLEEPALQHHDVPSQPRRRRRSHLRGIHGRAAGHGAASSGRPSQAEGIASVGSTDVRARGGNSTTAPIRRRRRAQAPSRRRGWRRPCLPWRCPWICRA